MPNNDRMKRLGCVRGAWARPLPKILRAALFLAAAQVIAVATAPAHEGHDHDKPAPLNLPIAPRVVAVTPDYEVVGVISGEQRLTIFLHHFATGEPVKDARITVSAGDQEAEAIAKEPGVFDLTASWLRTADGIDLIFRLTLPDDEDILTARLEAASTAAAVASQPSSRALITAQSLLIGLGGLAAGALLTLLIGANVRRRRAPADKRRRNTKRLTPVELRQRKSNFYAPLWQCLPLYSRSRCFGMGQQARKPRSHCLRFRQRWPQMCRSAWLMAACSCRRRRSISFPSERFWRRNRAAPRTVQLVGTVIADPNSFGRVQTGHAGRIEPADGGWPYVGKRVEKDDLLGYLQHHIEAYDKGNLQGEIAELEARIALQEAKLARYLKAPLAVPPIKIDEAKGEIEALRQKRKELLPTLAEREEIRAPISGVVSAANVVRRPGGRCARGPVRDRRSSRASGSRPSRTMRAWFRI